MTLRSPSSLRGFHRTLAFRVVRAISAVCQGALFAGGWGPVLAMRIGLQGAFRTQAHQHFVATSLPWPRPLKLAFASDLHFGPLTHPSVFKAAAAEIARFGPDVLLLGGDFVGPLRKYISKLGPFVAPLAERMQVIAVLGNHDLMLDRSRIASELRSNGARLLCNEVCTLRAPYSNIEVIGLDDPMFGDPRMPVLDSAADVRILLVHSPDGLLHLDGRGVTMAFCGHTHGGQVCLRNGHAPIVPPGRLSRVHVAGEYRVSGISDRLIVSRGLGCAVLPIRLNSPSEIHLCTLHAGASPIPKPSTQSPSQDQDVAI